MEYSNIYYSPKEWYGYRRGFYYGSRGLSKREKRILHRDGYLCVQCGSGVKLRVEDGKTLCGNCRPKRADEGLCVKLIKRVTDKREPLNGQ